MKVQNAVHPVRAVAKEEHKVLPEDKVLKMNNRVLILSSEVLE